MTEDFNPEDPNEDWPIDPNTGEPYGVDPESGYVYNNPTF
jgi:hypothetical protein